MVTLGIALCASVWPVSTAQAADKSLRDDRGDARAALDITSATVTVNKKTASFKVRVRDLRSSGAFSASIYQGTEDFDTYRLHITGYKTAGKKAQSRVGVYDFVGVGGPGAERYFEKSECSSKVAWSPRRDLVRVSIKLDGCSGFDPSVPVEARVLSGAKVSSVDHERKLADRTKKVTFRVP